VEKMEETLWMDSLWWDGISEGVKGVNKAKQIPHCVRDDTLE